ncbi:translation initiation factor IF-2-like [Passer montanus]|uniref:translation initiation factor IF-2-like n=1 Tax=Passer montanus TaxID=9160 RepID=UPI001962156B|nr:translation initiation factor IF-2-like [Passer montanus]
MSLLSGPRGAAPGSARLRRSSRPSPGTPSARRGASHGAGGAHLAAGQVPGSSGDAPTPAARTPPAPPPLPLPGAPGEAPPAGKGNACAEGGGGRPPPGAILNRLSGRGRCAAVPAWLGSGGAPGAGLWLGLWFRGTPGTEGNAAVAEGARSGEPRARREPLFGRQVLQPVPRSCRGGGRPWLSPRCCLRLGARFGRWHGGAVTPCSTPTVISEQSPPDRSRAVVFPYHLRNSALLLSSAKVMCLAPRVGDRVSRTVAR